MSEMRKCLNTECGKTYYIDKNSVDDGCCSFECWEQVHCTKPAEAKILEESKELFAFKS